MASPRVRPLATAADFDAFAASIDAVCAESCHNDRYIGSPSPVSTTHSKAKPQRKTLGSKKPRTLLLDLPTEILEKIVGDVVKYELPIYRSAQFSVGSQRIGDEPVTRETNFRLLWTCRLMYRLGRSIAYQVNTWMFQMDQFDYAPSTLEGWPSVVASRVGYPLAAKHIRKIYIRAGTFSNVCDVPYMLRAFRNGLETITIHWTCGSLDYPDNLVEFEAPDVIKESLLTAGVRVYGRKYITKAEDVPKRCMVVMAQPSTEPESYGAIRKVEWLIEMFQEATRASMTGRGRNWSEVQLAEVRVAQSMGISQEEYQALDLAIQSSAFHGVEASLQPSLHQDGDNTGMPVPADTTSHLTLDEANADESVLSNTGDHEQVELADACNATQDLHESHEEPVRPLRQPTPEHPARAADPLLHESTPVEHPAPESDDDNLSLFVGRSIDEPIHNGLLDWIRDTDSELSFSGCSFFDDCQEAETSEKRMVEDVQESQEKKIDASSVRNDLVNELVKKPVNEPTEAVKSPSPHVDIPAPVERIPVPLADNPMPLASTRMRSTDTAALQQTSHASANDIARMVRDLGLDRRTAIATTDVRRGPSTVRPIRPTMNINDPQNRWYGLKLDEYIPEPKSTRTL